MTEPAAPHWPQRPKISVIVPMYRTEAYLKRCLDSIVAQTFTDIEILCVDDASPDRCAEIAAAYAGRDGRVRVIRHEENRGLGAARNTGIAAARAPYVASVDSDDHIRMEMLTRLWEATEDGFFDVVECGYEHVREDGSRVMIYAPADSRIENVDHCADVFSITRNAFWNKLWRTALFVDNGIAFPEGMLFEDLATTPRVLTRCQHIRTIPDDLYVYVRHPQSIMSSSGARHLLDYFRCFELIAGDFAQAGLFERYRSEFLRSLDSNLHWHATLVTRSGMDEARTREYLMLMVMLRAGYLQQRDQLSGLSSKELLDRLRRELDNH
jgi:glycosyltransferase involved in cell wall biosynthesis